MDLLGMSRARGSHAPGRKAQNGLIAALPARERDALLGCSEQVALSAGEVLLQPGDRIRHVYFPCSALIGLVFPEKKLRTLELGLIGAEGMLGVGLTLDIEIADMRALAHAPGTALRIEAKAFSRFIALSRALREASDAYLYLLMSQLAALRICIREHALEARLARCLLLTRDRTRSNMIPLTPERFAWVGVLERAAILVAGRSLQSRNLVRYAGAGVRIVDADGLEAVACACYPAERDSLKRPFGRTEVAAPLQ
jgi:CRP-like cAMP-binding protein